MPRPRFAKLPPETRDALLDVAAEHFAADGFDVSYNRLIAATGVSKGSMYYYFDDKADLFVTVTERAVLQLMALVGEPQPVADAEAFWAEGRRLYRRLAQTLDDIPTTAGLVRAWMAVRHRPELAPHWGRFEGELVTWSEQVLQLGQNLGAVRTDLEPELLLSAMMGLGEAVDHYVLSRWSTTDDRDGLVGRGIDLLRRVAEP